MDEKSRKLLNILIFFSLIVTLGVTIITNPGNAMKLAPLSILLVLSFSLRRKIMFKGKTGDVLANCSFLFDIILLYFISLLDMAQVSQIYFYVIIIDAVLFYSIRLSLLTGLLHTLHMCLYDLSAISSGILLISAIFPRPYTTTCYISYLFF